LDVREPPPDSGDSGISARPDRVPTSMRLIYAVMLMLLVLALGVLEVASSRATARIADYPYTPALSASPAMPRR
jgi:hypothetical protein